MLFERRVALRAPSRSDRWDEPDGFALEPARAADHKLKLVERQEGKGRIGWLRSAGIIVLLLAATGVLARTVNAHYPMEEWLFFRYAKYWLYAALLALASLSAGLQVLAWLLPTRPRLGESCALGCALGILLFGLGIFVGGLLGGLGGIFFFAWPAGLLLLGGRRLWGLARALRRCFRHFGFAFVLPRGPVELLAAALILVSSLALYLQVLTPQNMGYDAGWYHLPIAQEYALRGAIGPFREGWYLGAYPQFASLLYTWAYLSPGDAFDHRALAAHIEWALFLATLAAMAPFVRRLLHGRRAPFAAAAIFLFPGIFLYDSNLIVGADHILAFFAPALGIALVRLGRDFCAREAGLAGALTAAALLTKYQGVYFVLPATLLVAVLTLRARRLGPTAVWLATTAAVSSAHWLKNLLWHGDPMYPLLHDFLPSRPFHPGAEETLGRAFWVEVFALKGTITERIVETAQALVTFSFVPHDWITFHGDKPVFGSLFTLTIPALLLLRRTRRIWLLVAGVEVGLAVWFVTSHQDRFLQALLPWMAACTAAILWLAWHESRAIRLPLVLLVALQIVWGGDVYFFRTHAMAGDAPLKALVDYVAAGHRQDYRSRHHLHEDLRKLGEGLPADATVLVHRHRDRLGLPSRVVTDEPGWQGAIEYLSLGGAGATTRVWRQLGITHVVWRDDCGALSPEDLSREAVFASAVKEAAQREPRRVSDWQMVEIGPPAWDVRPRPLRVAWLGCGGDPPLGIYDSPGLAIRVPAAPLKPERVGEHPLEALLGVDALVLRPSCEYAEKARPAIETHFEKVAKAGDVSLWLRRPGGDWLAEAR